MIPIRSDVQVWLAVGRTDMRKGMNGLAFKSSKLSAETRTRAISSSSEAPGRT